MKKIVVAAAIFLILGVVVYQTLLQPEEPEIETARAERGVVVQEVSETGQVRRGESINLSFETGGTLEEIYVKVSEKVKKGDVLAKLDDSQLQIQLQEANSSLEVAQAQLDKLLAGPTAQEIQLARTSVDNAQTAVNAAEQNLEDVRSQTEASLQSAYEDALNALQDSELKIANSYNTVQELQRTYFTASDQPGAKVRDQKQTIQEILSEVESEVNSAQQSQENQDIDQALVVMKESLEEVFQSLKIIREACEDPNYKELVSSTYKDALDTHRSLIATGLTNVVNAQQAISSTRISNQAAINQAQANLDSAEGQLKAAQEELDKLLSPPRSEDLNLYQAQVDQAVARVNLLYQKIQNTILRSPVDGEIAFLHKEKGEVVQPAASGPVITLLPTAPFTVTVDIYEEDVAAMNPGNPVGITLVAFPDQEIQGNVIAIDPAEKVIEEVVYYEVTISSDNFPEGTKPGMTADVVITTARKENVLFVPEDAVQEEDDQIFVEVLSGDQKQRKEVKVGLNGSNDRTEIIEGLSEGETVILP